MPVPRKFISPRWCWNCKIQPMDVDLKLLSSPNLGILWLKFLWFSGDWWSKDRACRGVTLCTRRRVKAAWTDPPFASSSGRWRSGCRMRTCAPRSLWAGHTVSIEHCEQLGYSQLLYLERFGGMPEQFSLGDSSCHSVHNVVSCLFQMETTASEASRPQV